MANKYLGTTFDIHTGGVDHIPTHHQNEIAQSVAAHNAPLANYWLHVNHITIDGKKISKSIGNTLYLEDLIAKGISPIAYKYWLYTSHYSTLSNFTIESVKAAQVGFNKIKEFISHYSHIKISDNESDTNTSERENSYTEKFLTYINDDLNTPKAIALIFDLLKDSLITDQNKKRIILQFDTVLKLGLDKTKSDDISSHIIDLAHRRKIARDNKDFALSDALREEIEESGYTIKDTNSETGFILEKRS